MRLNVTKNTLFGTLSGLFYKVITVIGSFIIQTITIRILGVEYVGLGSLFTSVLSVLSLAELGFGSALVFSMYKPIAENDDQHLNALLNYYRKIYNIVCLVILCLGLAIIPFIPFFVNGDCPNDINLYILYLIYLFNAVTGFIPPAYKKSILFAYQRRDIVNNYTAVIKIIQFALQIVVLLLFKNYYYFALVFAFSVLPVNFLVQWKTKKDYSTIKPFGELDHSEKKSIKTKVAALFGHQLGAKVIISSDSIIISAILGVACLGLYTNYYYIFYSIIEVLEIVKMSLTAGIGNKLETEDKTKLYDLFRKIIYVWMLIVGWSAACMLCMFQTFIELWLGDAYLLKMSLVIVIVAYFYFWQFRSILVVFKDAAGLWKEDWYKPYIGIIINLIGSVLLTFWFQSPSGVLIPTIVIMLFLYFPVESIVIFRKIFTEESIWRFFGRMLVFISLNVLSIVVSFIICQTIIIDSLILSLIVYFLIATLLSLAFFFVPTIKTKEFKGMIALIKRPLNRMLHKRG